MRKIQRPNIGQLSGLLILTIIFCILFIITNSAYWWMITAAIISLVIFVILVTYFCIRQKCFKQLAFSLVNSILFAAFIALIIYINK